MTTSQVEACYTGTLNERSYMSDRYFVAPDYLVELANVSSDIPYEYDRAQVYKDPNDSTYIGVEGSGCSCGGADDAWVRDTLAGCLEMFSDTNRRAFENALEHLL